MRKVRTLKRVVLEDNNHSNINLLALPMHDTKPVYFIANSASTIYRQTKKNMAYNYEKKYKIPLAYLRTNVQDIYNSWMNIVGIID